MSRSRCLMTLFIVVWLAGRAAFSLFAQQPQLQQAPAELQYLSKTPAQRAAELKSGRWIDVIAREVPPLQNDPGDRAPMVMWHGAGFDPLSPDDLDILRDRGLCQHLQLNEAMVPAAKILADEGMPVILMEGRTDNWPYSLAASPEQWAHQFDVTYQQPWFGKDDSSQWHGACPHLTEGWRILANNTRRTLEKFRDSGVRVDAVLVDYEGDPYPWTHLFQQLRHCKRCRLQLPSAVVRDRDAWWDYAWKQYVYLYDEFFARTVRDVFPHARVTNWHVVFSSAADPVRYFVRDTPLPALQPKFFSATNPVCYASDAVWQSMWNPANDLTQDLIDNFYANQIVHQAATDQRNRIAAGAAGVVAIPWVARVCLTEPATAKPFPLMTRERYRQSLGQLWKMGVETMQIFNPIHEGYEELAIMELQDAVAAYDAMLEE